MSCEIEKSIEILTQEWEKSVADYRYQNPQKLDREHALDIAIQALQEKSHLTPPQPLTLAELRGMDGKPVYIQLGDGDQFWAIVSIERGELGLIAEFYDHECPDEAFYGMWHDDPDGHFGLHVLGWAAYPMEPGREL